MFDDSSVMHERLFAQAGLSLERLRTFREIAAAGGITAAADNDANRQSQFSRQLRELEKFFGVELIRRGRGPLRLTGAGEELNVLAAVALRGLEEFLASCGSRPVELVVGAGESLIQWWLLPRLPDPAIFAKNITLAFENLRNEEILAAVKNGSLDFGVVSRSRPDARLESVSLGRLEFRLFVPERLAKTSKAFGASILQGLPLAQLTSAGVVASALESEMKRKRFTLDVRLKFSSYPQLALAVRSGRVAAVMPALAFDGSSEKEVRSVKLPFLDGLTREVRLVWNRSMAEVRPAIVRSGQLLARAWKCPF
jgi:DNA-binding transcriptional LysR family regulator